MALIKCPKCGEEVSDKSNSCIHCGSSLKQTTVCSECGKKLKDNKCSYCGYEEQNSKIENKGKTTTTVVTGSNKKSNKVLYIILGVILGGVMLVNCIWLLSDFLSDSSSGNKFDDYYNAKIASCSQKTLKEGLSHVRETLNAEADYEVFEDQSKAGKMQVYLSFYGYYTPLTLNNGEVTFGSVYSESSNTVQYGSWFIEDMLCGR